jgi:NTP pyrophosphatase (non-canonical NTP hydrolase)
MVEKMTPQVEEILNILQEECAEVIQVISKIRRFGMDDAYSGKTNRENLTQEVADVLLLTELLKAHGVYKDEDIQVAKLSKASKLRKWSNIYE